MVKLSHNTYVEDDEDCFSILALKFINDFPEIVDLNFLNELEKFLKKYFLHHQS